GWFMLSGFWMLWRLGEYTRGGRGQTPVAAVLGSDPVRGLPPGQAEEGDRPRMGSVPPGSVPLIPDHHVPNILPGSQRTSSGKSTVSNRPSSCKITNGMMPR